MQLARVPKAPLESAILSRRAHPIKLDVPWRPKNSTPMPDVFFFLTQEQKAVLLPSRGAAKVPQVPRRCRLVFPLRTFPPPTLRAAH